MKKEKLEYLDLYRAIAILAVLLIHTTSTAVHALPRDSLFYPFYLLINAAAQFAVPAFLFLSSLVYFYNYDDHSGINWMAYYTKRIGSIIVPYLAWSVFYFLWVTYYRGLPIGDRWPNFFKGLLFGGNYTHLYFIIILLQFFLLFPLFLRITRARWVRSNLIAIGIVLQTAFYLGNYYFFHMNKIGTFAGSYFLYFFLGAHAGILLKTSGTRMKERNWTLYGSFVVLSVIYLGQVGLHTFYPHYIAQPWISWINFLSDYGYTAVCCFLLIHVSAWLHSKGGQISRSLKSIGIASFGIYFIHPLFLMLWRDHVMTKDAYLYHVLLVAGGLVALLLSWILTVALQKWRKSRAKGRGNTGTNSMASMG